ncbi:MAG: DUF983 domain-containing protein [Cyclobacteriaceae bacterium]|nr:DUF983 domain-containing protein [Cyclobacteriaceae bacterium]
MNPTEKEISREPVENTIVAIIQTRCPKCREENMFVHQALNIKGFLKMHRSCPACGQDLHPEPGFYFGAMYFSYGLNVALMVTFGIAFEILFHPSSFALTLVSVFIPPLLLAPWNFRISRAIMIYVLGGIKYRGNKSKA